jgi:hypothetical protein
LEKRRRVNSDTAHLISGQSILQAAIITKVPPQIIQDIISQFDCIVIQDSIGQYHIDVGVAEGLIRGDRTEDIVRVCTTASIADHQGQARLMINLAALKGLQWKNSMKEVEDKSIDEIGNSNNKNTSTGLFPFMIAAVGESSDLSSIYGLMRQSPECVKDS